jgi:hypothetical protein
VTHLVKIEDVSPDGATPVFEVAVRRVVEEGLTMWRTRRYTDVGSALDAFVAAVTK